MCSNVPYSVRRVAYLFRDRGGKYSSLTFEHHHGSFEPKLQRLPAREQYHTTYARKTLLHDGGQLQRVQTAALCVSARMHQHVHFHAHFDGCKTSYSGTKRDLHPIAVWSDAAIGAVIGDDASCAQCPSTSIGGWCHLATLNCDELLLRDAAAIAASCDVSHETLVTREHLRQRESRPSWELLTVLQRR